MVPILIFASALSSDWVKTWRPFGVPSMTPHFLDLYNIPTALETLHKGQDPLLANPADPLHRSLNYPRIWLYLFSAARVTRENVSIVALFFCAFYLACISFLILDTKHAIDAIILLLAGLSAGPLLAMERGNNDLLVFSLVFLACVVANKNLKSALFGVAALLKIFPLAAMIMDTIRRPRKDRILAALLTAIVFALILMQWRDLNLIRMGTPVSRDMSYGALSLQRELLFDTLQWGFLTGLGWVIVLECWLAGAFAIASAWRNPRELDISIRDSKFAELFSAFGGMYVFTYAVGSNWDYRLILLLPTIPLALELARSAQHRVWGIAYLALVGLAENSLRFDQFGFTAVGHAVTFAIFIMVLGMLTRLFVGSLKATEQLPQRLQHLSPAVPSTQGLH
jgi:hypothetical protein